MMAALGRLIVEEKFLTLRLLNTAVGCPRAAFSNELCVYLSFMGD